MWYQIQKKKTCKNEVARSRSVDLNLIGMGISVSSLVINALNYLQYSL